MRLCACVVAALLAGSFLAGCAGGHEITEQQVAALKTQVEKLRAEQAALVERVERAEIALRAPKKGPEPVAAAGSRPDARARDDGDRPALDVVHLGPEKDADDPDADTPRPLLRASGNSGVIQEAASGKVLLDDRKESGDPGRKKPSVGSSAKGGGKPAGEKKP